MKRRWLWPLIAILAGAVVLLWTRGDPSKPSPARPPPGPAVPRPADQGTIGPSPEPKPSGMDASPAGR